MTEGVLSQTRETQGRLSSNEAAYWRGIFRREISVPEPDSRTLSVLEKLDSKNWQAVYFPDSNAPDSFDTAPFNVGSAIVDGHFPESISKLSGRWVIVETLQKPGRGKEYAGGPLTSALQRLRDEKHIVRGMGGSRFLISREELEKPEVKEVFAAALGVRPDEIRLARLSERVRFHDIVDSKADTYEFLEETITGIDGKPQALGGGAEGVQNIDSIPYDAATPFVGFRLVIAPKEESKDLVNVNKEEVFPTPEVVEDLEDPTKEVEIAPEVEKQQFSFSELMQNAANSLAEKGSFEAEFSSIDTEALIHETLAHFAATLKEKAGVSPDIKKLTVHIENGEAQVTGTMHAQTPIGVLNATADFTIKNMLENGKSTGSLVTKKLSVNPPRFKFIVPLQAKANEYLGGTKVTDTFTNAIRAEIKKQGVEIGSAAFEITNENTLKVFLKKA